MSTQTKRVLVIYHSADFDGIFSREIARLHFGAHADYLGWNYGDPVPVVPEQVEHLYMIDISVKGLMNDHRLVWIDHHKTAMAEFPAAIPGYRIDGVAACRLAWQWFSNNRPHWGGDMPRKEDYFEHRVHEPLAVRLAGEYDVWDKSDPRAELFQHGLRSQDIHWPLLLNTAEDAYNYVDRLLAAGEYLAYAAKESDARRIQKSGFDVQWEGLTFLALNGGGNSLAFAAGIKPHHDGLLAFRWERDKWRVSLYGVPGRPDVDLSAIATRYGGGGHKQACGFECQALPWTLATCGAVLAAVVEERMRQNAKWGEQNHEPITWSAILTEECGEFAEAALHHRFGGSAAAGLRMEAIHCAAVAVQIVECLDRAASKGGA